MKIENISTIGDFIENKNEKKHLTEWIRSNGIEILWKITCLPNTQSQ